MKVIDHEIVTQVTDKILNTPSLVCLWDFEDGSLYSKGRYNYRLLPAGPGSIDVEKTGPLSGHSIRLEEQQYCFIPRSDCPGLNIYGKNAQVTVLALVKREPKTLMPNECEAVAGMWLESEKKRQYCLFLNLWIHDSANQVCGHISGVGGPTEGEKWCMDASIGKTPVLRNEWSWVGFTYDGRLVKSYLNGELDLREGRNPYPYTRGVFDGGENGADFTVGAVHRMGEMGNFFKGNIGALAVFDRALDELEMNNLYSV